MPSLFPQWPSLSWIERALQHSPQAANKQPAETVVHPVSFDYTTVAQLHQLISANAEKLVPTTSEEDVEVRAGEQAHLSHLLNTLFRWKLSLMPGAARNFKQFYTAEQLIYAVDLSLQAKAGSSGLKELCVLALKALFPAVNDVVWATMAQSSLPSASSVTRHMMTLEVALLLMKRHGASATATPRVRYGLVDASPAWGLDWLWIQELSVPGGAELISLYHISVGFLQAMLLWQAGITASTGVPEPRLVPAHLQNQLQHIAAQHQTHTYTPVVIASGYANLSHKVSACLHAFMLHCGSVEAMQQHVDSFLTWTTDMGTESGFSEYRCSNVSTLLPAWWRAPALENDLEEVEDELFDVDMATSGDDQQAFEQEVLGLQEGPQTPRRILSEAFQGIHQKFVVKPMCSSVCVHAAFSNLHFQKFMTKIASQVGYWLFLSQCRPAREVAGPMLLFFLKNIAPYYSLSLILICSFALSVPARWSSHLQPNSSKMRFPSLESCM